MRLYIWNKEVMQEWMSGLAFAIAESEEQARALVLKSLQEINDGNFRPTDHEWPYGLDKPADEVRELDQAFGLAIFGSS